MEDLIYYLKNRDHDRKLKEIYNQILKCDLLLIDEVGYLPLNKEEAIVLLALCMNKHQ